MSDVDVKEESLILKKLSGLETSIKELKLLILLQDE
jgi:hypothetical protein